MWHTLKYALHLLCALPKTLYFNFHYLPPHQAWKLPIWVSSRVRLVNMAGQVRLDYVKCGMVHLGLSRDRLANYAADAVWNVDGTVCFHGKARLGTGIQINLTGGQLHIGHGVTVTQNLAIHCATHVELGEDCMLSWNVTLMDHDFHHIAPLDGEKSNHPAPIKLANHVWLGCHCLLLKGVEIGSGCVVAAGSVVSRGGYAENQLLGGNPARVVKQWVRWYR